MADGYVMNAKITSTKLGYEGHGIGTFSVNVDLEKGGSQGFGGWAITGYNKKLDRQEGSKFGGESIFRILDAAGVESWEELPGRPVRVRKSAPHGGVILAIGHFLDEDKWFSLEEAAERCKGASE